MTLSLEYVGQIVGAQGPPGPPTVIKGSVNASTPAPSAPSPGDLHIVAPTVPVWAPAGTKVGDGLTWDGTSWVNVGQIRGPVGATGPQGDQSYIQTIVGDGNIGDVGHLYYRTGTGLPPSVPTNTTAGAALVAAGWTDSGDLSGPQGDRGALLLSGTNNPSGPGATLTQPAGGFIDGDFYFNTTSGDVFRFDGTGRSWVQTANVVGPKGATGDDVHLVLGDGTDGAAGHIYMSTTASGAVAPGFAGVPPTGWTDLGSVAGPAGPAGPAPVFGTPTVTQVAAGGAPTIGITGTGVTGDPLVLAVGVVAPNPTHVYLGQNGDAAGVLYYSNADAEPDKTKDVGPAASGQDAALVADGWTRLGNLVGPRGATGPTPALLTGATDPGAGTGKDGDLYLQTVDGTTGKKGDLYTKTGGAWTKGSNLMGPMGPAISIKGNLLNTATAMPAAPTAGAAYILEEAGKNPGDAWTVSGWYTLGGAPKVGEIVYYDGTAWHNGGQIQGPVGPKGSTPTIKARVADATSAASDPPITGTGARPAAVGDLIVDPGTGTEVNLGSVMGPQGVAPNLALAVGDGTDGLASHLYYHDYTGGKAPVFKGVKSNTAAQGWVDAGMVPLAPATHIYVSNTGGETDPSGTWTVDGGSTDPGVTAPQRGDLAVNRADKVVSVNTGTTWQPIAWAAPGLPGVVVSSKTGEKPSALGTATLPSPLVTGTLFVNTADKLTWTYDGKNWQALTSPAELPAALGTAGQVLAVNTGASAVEWKTLPTATVTESKATGDVPVSPAAGEQLFSFTGYAPVEGDVFFNSADKRHWVYDGTWKELGSPAQALPQVYKVATAGITPMTASVRAAGGVLDSTKVTLVEGDIFVNTTDSRTWVYDGTSPYAASGWLTVGLDNDSVEVTAVATEVPGTPAGGQTSHNNTNATWNAQRHQVGDLFVNTASGQTWVCTAAGTGTAATWQVLATPRVIVSAVGAESPASPGGATIPSPLAAGTVFVNTSDSLTWVYDGTSPYAATGWQQTSFAPAHPAVTTTATTAQTPGTNPPAAPKEGDVFINTADNAAWVYGGTVPGWNPLSVPIPGPATASSGQVLTVNAGATAVEWATVTHPQVTVKAGGATNGGDAGHVYYTVLGTVPATIDTTAVTGNVTGDPTTGWVDAGAPVTLPQVVTSSATGDTPTAAGGPALVTAAGTVAEGWVFINTADDKRWIYGPDPANAGQSTWLEDCCGCKPTVEVSATAGDTPAGAAPAAPPAWQDPRVLGSVFGDWTMNSIDSATITGLQPAQAPTWFQDAVNNHWTEFRANVVTGSGGSYGGGSPVETAADFSALIAAIPGAGGGASGSPTATPWVDYENYVTQGSTDGTFQSTGWLPENPVTSNKAVGVEAFFGTMLDQSAGPDPTTVPTTIDFKPLAVIIKDQIDNAGVSFAGLTSSAVLDPLIAGGPLSYADLVAAINGAGGNLQSVSIWTGDWTPVIDSHAINVATGAGVEGPPIPIDIPAPAPPHGTGPCEGSVYVNTADGLTWIHDGTTWQSITPAPPVIPKTYFGTAGAGKPTGTPVSVGARYLDSATGDIYVAGAGPAWPAAKSDDLVAGDTFFDFTNNDVYEGQ